MAAGRHRRRRRRAEPSNSSRNSGHHRLLLSVLLALAAIQGARWVGLDRRGRVDRSDPNAPVNFDRSV